MTGFGEINRQFSMEGATHLYSSSPAMLTPADLYRVKDNPTHKAALQFAGVTPCHEVTFYQIHNILLRPAMTPPR